MWIFVLAIVTFTAIPQASATNITAGDLCEPRMYHQTHPSDPRRYFACKKTDFLDSVGNWEERVCEIDEVFAMLNQTCVPKSHVRRQQSMCNVEGVGCQPAVTCPSAQFIGSGQSCSWLQSSLQPDSRGVGSFLQCVPSTIGTQCGQWQSMSCPLGTQYQPQLQVCVAAAVQGNCPQQQQVAVCPCSQAAQCPQTTSCYVQTCCSPQPVVQPQVPNCPSGQRAISSCASDVQCPQGYTCQNGGCCIPPLPMCPGGAQAIQTCTGVGQSTCPAGYDCQNGGCCILPQCNNAQPAVQRCVGTGQSTCPAGYECQNGGCCLLPRCPDGSVAPQVCGPSAQCPANFNCQNGACCPAPMPQCPDGVTATARCVGTGQSSCPTGQYCANGGCCRLPNCANGQIAVAVCTPGGLSACPLNYACQNNACCPLPQCPVGGMATQLCTQPGACPAATYCYNNQGCCPIPRCNDGTTSTQPCSVGATACPAGFRCENGGCCPIPLPQCPDGRAATQACTQPGQCGATNYCYLDTQGRQGCCPIPTCEDGSTAVQPCTGTGQGTCAANFLCRTGGCCPIPLPNCPQSNQPAIQACTSNTNCPANYYCYQNAQGRQGCCFLPSCPNGAVAQAACQGTGQSTCQAGYQCVNGGCCQLNCPDGSQPLQICGPAAQCPANSACQNGVCCLTPLPRCTDGATATARCQGTGQSTCPVGYSCQGGGCCLLPMCPDGRQSVALCPAGTTCPNGYSCQASGICCLLQLQPLPICPSTGTQAIQRCDQTTSFCPQGYDCISGGCCPQAVQPTCLRPICYCATLNNMCPYGTGCQQGYCCAGATSVFVAASTPGSSCQQPAQCSGYPANAACMGGYCSCINGARSDGIRCTQRSLKYNPKSSCNQFGKPCDGLEATEEVTVEGILKRKSDRQGLMRDDPGDVHRMMDALGIKNDTEPDFWIPLPQNNHCSGSQDCTPDHVCANHTCLAIKLPGEKLCEYDEQCLNTCNDHEQNCPLSVCVFESEVMSTCRCEKGAYLYESQCVRTCPAHTKAEGDVCMVRRLPQADIMTRKHVADASASDALLFD